MGGAEGAGSEDEPGDDLDRLRVTVTSVATPKALPKRSARAGVTTTRGTSAGSSSTTVHVGSGSNAVSQDVDGVPSTAAYGRWAGCSPAGPKS